MKSEVIKHMMENITDEQKNSAESYAKEITKKHCLELFHKLSEPLSCGVIRSDGIKHQQFNGEWSSERIFILSDQIFKENPIVIYRSYYNDHASWVNAICRYLQSESAFNHPKLKMYCIQKDFVTIRNLDFDLDIL